MMWPFLAFLLASLISGGLNGIFVRYVSTEFGPLTGSFLRFFAAFLLLLPFWIKKKEIIEKKDVIKFLPFAINVIAFSFAILHTSVIMSNILYALVPLWTAFLGYFLLKEKLSGNHILGLIVSLLGMAILIKGSIETSDILTFGEPAGNMLIMLGVFFWGFWLIGSRSLSKKYSSLTILFFTFFIAAILTLLLLPFESIFASVRFTEVTYKGVLSLLGVILFSSIALYFLYQWLIKNTSAFIASLIQYGGIAFGAIAGPVIFQEKLTFDLVLGAIFVVAGVFWATTYTQLKNR